MKEFLWKSEVNQSIRIYVHLQKAETEIDFVSNKQNIFLLLSSLEVQSLGLVPTFQILRLSVDWDSFYLTASHFRAAALVVARVMTDQDGSVPYPQSRPVQGGEKHGKVARFPSVHIPVAWISLYDQTWDAVRWFLFWVVIYLVKSGVSDKRKDAEYWKLIGNLCYNWFPAFFPAV